MAFDISSFWKAALSWTAALWHSVSAVSQRCWTNPVIIVRSLLKQPPLSCLDRMMNVFISILLMPIILFSLPSPSTPLLSHSLCSTFSTILPRSEGRMVIKCANAYSRLTHRRLLKQTFYWSLPVSAELVPDPSRPGLQHTKRTEHYPADAWNIALIAICSIHPAESTGRESDERGK